VWGKRHLVERESVGTAVHPHACGENGMSVSYSEHADGSPPRVWGKLTIARIGRVSVRFTPTRVGKTSSCLLILLMCTVHPHACGEN